MPLAMTNTRVHGITYGIPKEIEGQHGEEKRQRGWKDQVGRRAHSTIPIADHPPPTGCGRLDTQADETQKGLGVDVGGDG